MPITTIKELSLKQSPIKVSTTDNVSISLISKAEKEADKGTNLAKFLERKL